MILKNYIRTNKIKLLKEVFFKEKMMNYKDLLEVVKEHITFKMKIYENENNIET